MITYVHKNMIVVGDVIVCPDGRERTICQKDIRRDNVMGITIFGDSYRCGSKLVPIVVFKKII